MKCMKVLIGESAGVRRTPPSASLRGHDCLFIAQLIKNQPEGRNFLSGIKPGQLVCPRRASVIT